MLYLGVFNLGKGGFFSFYLGVIWLCLGTVSVVIIGEVLLVFRGRS